MPKYKPKLYYPPQANDFYLARRTAGLSQKQVADLMHVHHRTVINWETSKTAIPYSAFKLLRIMGNHELPGKEWEGWTLRGGALFNPSGRKYLPHELLYIRNMLQMARIWIAERQKNRELIKQRAPIKRQHLQLIQGGLK